MSRSLFAPARLRPLAAHKNKENSRLSSRIVVLFRTVGIIPAGSPEYNIMANGTEETATKPRKVDRLFVSKDGKRHNRVLPDTTTVIHKFLESGYELEMGLAKLADAQRVQGLAFGVSQVVGNAYGGIKTEEDAILAAEARWDTLTKGGWSIERQTGPQTSDVLEAYCAAMAAAGQPISDDKKAEIGAKLVSEELKSKDLLNNDKIAAAYHKIKHDRALARMQKFEAAAKSSTAALPVF